MASTTQPHASRLWRSGARGGFAVSGLLHVVLGWLIVSIALGSQADAEQSAALSRLRDIPGGVVVLWVSAAALAALALWQLAQVGSGDAKDRAKAGGKGILYLALAATAGSVALGAGSSDGDQQASGFAAALMQAPAGRALVAALAVAIVATAVFHAVKGATQRFTDDLTGLPRSGVGTFVRATGTAGYVAKGAALAVVGVLFAIAAWQADPEEAQGIDGAIESMLALPAGPVLVLLTGVGFGLYGLYSFARARFARL